MSGFVPNNRHQREALLFLYNLQINATEAHQMLVKAYHDNALSIRSCQLWFERFKMGDYDVDDKDHGKPPKSFQNHELQSLLDEDDTQTQLQLANSLNVTQQTISNRLCEMGKILKEGKWEMGPA
jgi:[histone H3]-lysine36 N-dimethyltransferase SETMAR